MMATSCRDAVAKESTLLECAVLAGHQQVESKCLVPQRSKAISMFFKVMPSTFLVCIDAACVYLQAQRPTRESSVGSNLTPAACKTGGQSNSGFRAVMLKCESNLDACYACGPNSQFRIDDVMSPHDKQH